MATDDSGQGRPLTPILRALLLAERALAGCSCGSQERAAALEAIRRAVERRAEDTELGESN